MSLSNWLKNLWLSSSRKEENEKLLKIAEELVERLEKEIDNLADKALHTPDEYKINHDGSRSTIKPSLYYRVEAEKLLPELFNELLSYSGAISENEKRVIKKLAASKARELRKNEVELGLCSVDVLDVPDKVRRKVKYILDVKFQSRVDLGALKEACKMAGLDCIGLGVSLDFLNKERIGKILIVYHDHVIRFRGFDKDGNIWGVSGNDNGAIRRILVSPAEIVDEEGHAAIFMQREVENTYSIKDVKGKMVIFAPKDKADKLKDIAGLRKLSDEELKNIHVDVDEALALMFPSKPKDTEEIGADPARVWYLKGRKLYDDLQRYEEAIEAFNRAIETDPKDSGYGAWDYKVRCLLELRRYEEALKVIDGVTMLSDSTEWYYKKGKILEELQRDKEALDAYDKVLELIPSDDLAQDRRDKLLQRIETREGGIVTFKAALEKIDKLAGELKNTVYVFHEGVFMKLRGVTEAQGEKKIMVEGFFGGEYRWAFVPFSVFVKLFGGEIILAATKTIKKRYFEEEPEFFVEDTAKLLKKISDIEEVKNNLLRKINL